MIGKTSNKVFVRLGAVFMCMLTLTTNLMAQGATFDKVVLPTKLPHNVVLVIQDNEVTFKDGLIKRVDIGKEASSITYLNSGDSPRRPRYSFHVYNAYGMLLSFFQDAWNFATIEPGNAATENVSHRNFNYQELLEFSTINLPHDWNEPVYLVIAGGFVDVNE